MLSIDPDAYQHVWEGYPQQITDAIIFRRRVVVEDFTVDPETFGRPYFGVDRGFADDPTVMVKFYVKADELFIDQEVYAFHKELDELGELFGRVDGSDAWPIKADGSRPETISYVRRQSPGFNIEAADKWPGSVEDGVAHLKAYKRIIVRPECRFTAQEFRLYSYKVDKKTKEILPIIVDKHNHLDAVRYGHDGIIQRRGSIGIWKRFSENAAQIMAGSLG